MIDGGPIGGQVWTAAGSPYVVSGLNGDLTVTEGQELRIEAGTTVLFAASTRLRVDGFLNVAGTSEAPVIMRGEPASTEVTWNGIQTAWKGSPQVRITGANIQNAWYGTSILAGDARVDRSTFEHCNTGLSVSLTKETYAFDSIISRNNKVGFECDGCGTVRLTNLVAQGNTYHGVVQHGRGVVNIINATIDGNENGVDFWPGGVPPNSVTLINTVLSNNEVAIEDDHGAPGELTIVHSTFWANSAANLRVKRNNAAVVIIDGNTAPTGTGNVVADPKYVSATDLHLTANSPCIDTGTTTGAPRHDLDQAARPVEGDGVPDTDGSTFDRGAYEFGATRVGDGGAGGESGGGAGGETGSAGSDSAGAGGDAVGGASGGNDSGGNASGGDASGGDATTLGGSANTSGGNPNASGGRVNSSGGSASTSGGKTTGSGGILGVAGRNESGAAGASSGDSSNNDGCACNLGASSDPRASLALLAAGFALLRRRAQRKTR